MGNAATAREIILFCPSPICCYDGFLLYFRQRRRPPVEVSFDESERRAIALKEYSKFRSQQHRREMEYIRQSSQLQVY